MEAELAVRLKNPRTKGACRGRGWSKGQLRAEPNPRLRGGQAEATDGAELGGH